MTLRMPGWALVLCMVGVVGITVLSPLAGFLLAVAMTVATRDTPSWRNGFGVLAILLLAWFLLGMTTSTTLGS